MGAFPGTTEHGSKMYECSGVLDLLSMIAHLPFRYADEAFAPLRTFAGRYPLCPVYSSVPYSYRPQCSSMVELQSHLQFQIMPPFLGWIVGFVELRSGVSQVRATPILLVVPFRFCSSF